MPRKIAPHVAYIIEHVGAYWDDTKMPRTKEARSELRALLAVARAAQKQADHGDNWTAALRALTRLRRLSNPSPRSRKRGAGRGR